VREKVGLICAGDRELAPFLPHIREEKIARHALVDVHEGLLENVPVCAVCSGVGKVNAAIAAAEAREKEFAAKSNRLEVEKLFMADGLTEADYADLIDDIVSDDADKTMKLAKSLLAVVKSQKSAAEKAVRAELLKKTPKPPAGEPGNEGMTKEKFRKLSPKERYDFSVNNPEEYKKLYGGNE